MPFYQWEGSLNVFDRPIAFHRPFVEIAGDVAGAVFLSQLCYWAKRALPEKEFWFYKSVEEWKEETGLSRDQQLRIRAVLKEKGILEEDEARIQHRIYFRLNWEPLVTYPRGGAIPPSRETRHGQVEKHDSAKSGNTTWPSRETRFRSSSETTAEITTETTQRTNGSDIVSKSKYSTFQSRYYSLTGTTPGKIPLLVNKYLELCSKYGEEDVLDLLPTWVDGQGGGKALKGNKYGPGNFLEQVEIMLTTEMISDSDRKEASYPHGLEQDAKWAAAEEHLKTLRKPEPV